MVRLEYSQIVRRKMRELQQELTLQYGETQTKKIIGSIVKGVRILEVFPEAGIEVSKVYDVDCDYRYLFVRHNYFFYRQVNETTVIVLEMFHEKEDFMQKLFGINTTSQDTLEYWSE